MAKGRKEIREYIKFVAALSERAVGLEICEVLLLRDEIEEKAEVGSADERDQLTVLLADSDLRAKSVTLVNLPAAYWWGRESLTLGRWTIRSEPPREYWWWYLDVESTANAL